ncbi:dTDP-4-dehydrorhamnose reductase [Lachnospiraceae bacterium HCP1S3_C3]|nr:dTDP-4-dehydrorhamnose reductase [Lachnospiraceae bacterium]MDD6857018.1 dTDP-4-dehydrorhamnose reductase [Lachnospiraceae bacterium]
MKKLLVTGANGQLGREISNMYEKRDGIEVVRTDVGELDITDVDATVKMVKEVKPYAIINCAAYTAVDKCETDVDLAYKINAIGPRNLSIASSETGAKLVHVSTDYVFKGDGTKPYIEFDTPNPNSMYGTTKLAGEKFVQEFSDKHFIIRTAWLYGDGKNFVKTMLRLAQNGPEVNVVGDQIGSPTSTKVLADIIETLMWTDNYGLFHGTCEGICSWADFTEEIFKLAGKDTKVNHITSEEYANMFPASAKRPAYSVLDNYMLKLTTDHVAADWHDAIAEYIKEGWHLK